MQGIFEKVAFSFVILIKDTTDQKEFSTLQVKLVLERTVRCSQTVWFFVMFDMFDVRFWAKM